MDGFNYNTLSKKMLNNRILYFLDKIVGDSKSIAGDNAKVNPDKGIKDNLGINTGAAVSIPVFDLGIISYDNAYKLQLDIFELVRDKDLPGVILMLEHNPVITTGNSGKKDNVISDAKSLQLQGIDLVQSNRGGDVTFHGPGQLVCYTVFNLKKFGRDLTAFVYNLEEVIIGVLALYGISAYRIEKLRGVFTDKGKIASVGLHVKKWITIHGFSFNVNVDLGYYKNIVACGLKDYRQTSLKEIMHNMDISVPDVKEYILDSFKSVFGIEISIQVI